MYFFANWKLETANWKLQIIASSFITFHNMPSFNANADRVRRLFRPPGGPIR
jgi:hypothetical protein